MIHLKRILIFISVLPLLSQVLFCSQNENILRVTAVGKSSPNITRPAKARAMALRAAQIEGYRELARAAGLEKVYRVKGQPGHRVNNVEERKIEAFMKGARVVGKRFISHHEVEITMEIEISEIVDIASDLKTERFNETLTALRNKIESLEKEMSKIRAELKKAKNILAKLEDKSR
jgi:hypothetical protein